MGEAGNQLVGLQGVRTGPMERYKSTGMGSPCYLAPGSKSRSLDQAAEPAWLGPRGNLKPLAEPGLCSHSSEGPGREGDAPDLGLAALPYPLMPKPLTHGSLLPKQDAPLPCLGEWGGLPRASRRECPGAAGKANDRLENWGIRLT